jgi:hypothetical protein
VVNFTEGSTPMLCGNEHWSPAGVKEQGMWTGGSSRNLGGPFFSAYKMTGKGNRWNNTLA